MPIFCEPRLRRGPADEIIASAGNRLRPTAIAIIAGTAGQGQFGELRLHSSRGRPAGVWGGLRGDVELLDLLHRDSPREFGRFREQPGVRARLSLCATHAQWFTTVINN